MKEELTIPEDWGTPEDREFWRGEVKRRAEQRLAEYPNAKAAPEIRSPEKAAQVLYYLSRAVPQRKIARATGFHLMEVSRLGYHHSGTLAQYFEKKRPELAARYFHLAEKLAAAMEEKVDSILNDEEELKKTHLDKMAVSLGIVNDKGMNVAGLATSKVEHVRGPSVEDYEKIIKQARERMQKDARTIDVPADEVAEA